jgi:hypothetical protein
MAFGDTVTITVNAVDKVLKRINPGIAWTSEFLLRETTGEFRLKIRHSPEGKLLRGEPMHRHNVELSQTVFGVAPDDGYTVVVSTTIRNPERIAAADVDKLSDGLADFVKANGADLVDWLN